ncbi:magnesium transporter CorA family protein [Lacticaseibacillus sp. GG6-2]
MISSYVLKDGRVQPSDADGRNIIILENTADEEEHELADRFDLPHDLFAADEEAVEVTRFEKLANTALADARSLVLMDLAGEEDSAIETRLEPVTVVLAEDLLIIHFAKTSTLWQNLLDRDDRFDDFEELLGKMLLRIYVHFLLELEATKKQIDALDQAARTTTKNQELFNLADTVRKVVFLDHTLQDMALTVNALLADDHFLTGEANATLVYRIQLRERQAKKMIALYRDLLEAIGGLFSDMMDNNLNHLMKYLDSAALVVAVPALVSGLWGMNTGGLPGKDSTIGFVIMFLIALGLGVLTAVHLSRKDYSQS